jgi:uncharacterized protein (TIGR00375 family)
MRFIADFHIHSRYSRATSRDMCPEALWRWAQLKGITVIGTGDFTHPGWRRELEEKLEPAGNGLFTLKDGFNPDGIPASCKAEVYFLLSAEISCIYKKHGKTRKIHSLLLAPGFDEADRLNTALAKIGNLGSDGRPILGLDAKELLKTVTGISDEMVFIPAHVWTPHFSVFGAASGFDSEDFTPAVFAIETGLSSDPPMNWRLSALDGITLVSNSDAHSPAKIGREANIFDTGISYKGIWNSLRTRQGFLGTIEFFPEEGKYHYDGHRPCGMSLTPEETIGNGYRCPACGRKVTVGVMHRVGLLADRVQGFRPQDAPDYRSIIPLPEILSEVLKVGVNTKTVGTAYHSLLQKLGSEFNILLEIPVEEIGRASTPLIQEAVSRMRTGKVYISPGYDGEFGKVKIMEPVGSKKLRGQRTLF